jgi:hypothetical protein
VDHALPENATHARHFCEGYMLRLGENILCVFKLQASRGFDKWLDTWELTNMGSKSVRKVKTFTDGISAANQTSTGIQKFVNMMIPRHPVHYM